MIGPKTVARLGKLSMSEPYFPRWNEEGFFRKFEELGWATGELRVSARTKRWVRLRPSFLITESGIQVLTAAKSTAEGGGK